MFIGVWCSSPTYHATILLTSHRTAVKGVIKVLGLDPCP